MTSRTPLRLRLVLLVSSIILSLLVVEGAARVRQYFKYGSAANTVFKTTTDPVSGLLIPEPGSATRTIRINSKGFRSPELEEPKPLGRIRLAFVGSSTTFCAEVSGNEATWPNLVWKELQKKHPDVKLDYLNASVVGYLVNTSLKNLEDRVKPLQPDLIVIYEGFNDFSKDTRELARKQGLYSGESMEVNDFLSRYSLTWYLIEKKSQMILRGRRAAQPTGRLTFDPVTLSQGFQQRYRGLVEASQQIAPVTAIATLSQWLRPEQSTEEQIRACQSTLYYNPFLSVDGILKGMEAYNHAIRSVAQETGAILIDDENAIPGDDRHFNDSVHFNDTGAEIMAQRVVDALEKSEAFKQLVESHRFHKATAN